jgi:hypothetical protein
MGADVLCYTEEPRNLELFVFSDLYTYLRERRRRRRNINYAVALLYRIITLFDNCVLYLRPLLRLAHEQPLELVRSSSNKRYLSDKIMSPHYALPLIDTHACL